MIKYWSLRINRYSHLITQSVIYRCTRVMSKRDRMKVFAVMVLQILFGFLDLLGVAVIGVLGALAVTGVGSGVKGNRVNSALEILRISEYSFQTQVTVLGILAAILLIGRTIFSIIFTRRIMHFLSNRGAQLANVLVRKILNRPLLEIQHRTSQEIVYSITSGVNAITLGIIGVAVNLVSDVSLLFVLGIGLFIVNPSVAFLTFFVFSCIAFILYRISHVKAQKLGELNAQLSIQGNEQMLEVLDSYRELFVKNRRAYYAGNVSELRFKLSHTSAELSFMPFVSKYIIETSMVIGALLISAVQFKMQDAVHAVATLSIFLAAGTRIVPAILRVQQGALSIKSSLGSAGPTLDYIEELEGFEFSEASPEVPEFIHPGFEAKIDIDCVSFRYPNKDFDAITDVNLSISPGQMVALVGPSGGGKTTLIDLILGILSPQHGNIRISNHSPDEAIQLWPGAIAYVPQNISIANGTIRSNIELGYPPLPENEAHLVRAISTSHLTPVISKLPSGWDSLVGEKGSKLSGGERQRLGIARAIFTNPRLLVLDEATSALDSETEQVVSESITQLRGGATILIVAHRLSTVLLADVVAFVNEGKVIASGSFEELRAQVPDFDNQAKLMGF
jgi:ATP-binding cassette, subfamily B, bacterial PglK